MNFLAHLYLSGEDTKLQVGNFIGDFVKGKTAMLSYEHSIIRGIELHRAIDEFTDSHKVVLESKVRLRPKYHHYSGVIVDVFYDHYLAANWNAFHDDLLPDYADKVYGNIQEHLPILPEQVQYMFPFMVRGNWLVNYARLEGINRALYGMSRRTTYESKMDEAVGDLKTHYDEFKNEFMRFFPDLKSHCKSWLEENN